MKLKNLRRKTFLLFINCLKSNVCKKYFKVLVYHYHLRKSRKKLKALLQFAVDYQEYSRYLSSYSFRETEKSSPTRHRKRL